MIVRVDCAADARGEPMPRRVHLGGRVVELAAILDQWPGAGHHYVKARGADGALYILRQDETNDVWELTLYRAPGQADTGL